ncbi:hypothetical protein [Azotobacter vinelandii]|uniref:hypothetical protein n=1 Tax=Azotobacter vinelandii TaxID=354 RepID=UPI002666EA72|nr:hypothetical protein [Azotobacter vinelandii]WKN20856.1 hypothetical protein AVAEIV_003882 [Azotobacter vinelandii]
MSASQRELAKSKAEKMIRHEIDRISRSQFPRDDFCSGMIELAYELDLLTDNGHDYWRHSASIAVEDRRKQLNAKIGKEAA